MNIYHKHYTFTNLEGIYNKREEVLAVWDKLRLTSAEYEIIVEFKDGDATCIYNMDIRTGIEFILAKVKNIAVRRL